MLRELLAVFDVDTTKAQSSLSALHGQISEGIEVLKGFGEAFLSGMAIEGLHHFVDEQIKAGAALNDTSDRLGVATDDLQKFGLAANLAGASTEDANTGLRFLNRTVGEALMGNKEAAKTFSDLGIDIKDASGNARGAVDIASDFGDSIEGLGSQAERTATIMKVFGRGGAALLPLFKNGSKDIKDAAREFEELGGGMSGEFVKASDEADDNVTRLQFGMKGLKSTIALSLIPAFNWLTLKATDFVKKAVHIAKHTNIVKTAMMAMGAVAGVVAAVQLAKVASTLSRIAGFGPGIGGIVKTFLKFGPIALLILAIYLIFDDLYTMMTGGNSVIGETLDKFGGFGAKQQLIDGINTSLQTMVDLWNIIWGTTDKASTSADEFGKKKTAFDSIVLVITDMVRGITMFVLLIEAGVAALVSAAKLTGKFLASPFTGGKDATMESETASAKAEFMKSIDGISAGLNNALTGDNGLFGTKTIQGPQVMPDGSRVQQLKEITVSANIKVDGSKNPSETGKAVRDSIVGLTNQGNQNAYEAVGSGAGDDE